MPGFDRGFKSWAEHCAVGLREELELKAYAPLSYEPRAEYLEVKLLTPKDIPNIPSDCIRQLLDIDPEGWSAVSFSNKKGHTVIYNPRHSAGRRSSDIMHELAHIIIDHNPTRMIVSTDGNMIMRSFDQKQEDEADWLCGCLLLPREALLYIKRKELSDRQICEIYVVTLARLRYRLDITGVRRQLHLKQHQPN